MVYAKNNPALKTLEIAESENTLIEPSRRRDRRRKNHHKDTVTRKPFVSWDGEAAGNGMDEKQKYCVIGNSSNGILVNREGALGTAEIFEFMLNESKRLGECIHVAFGFNYDVNHIIRSLPFNKLRRLHRKNVVWYGPYRIEWYPAKWFSVAHRKSKRFIMVYDTIGFWGTSLLAAIGMDPKLSNHPSLKRIESGKRDRGTFTLDQLDSKVIPYFHAEMELHRQLMENLRDTLIEARLVPAKWYGPSAIISSVYRQVNLKQHMNRPESDLTRERKEKNGRIQRPDTGFAYTLPDDVNRVARNSFAGGRFEQFKIGYYEGPVYGYDITSAYPYAMLTLPSLSSGQWNYIDSTGLREWRRKGRNELPWGFYRIHYGGPKSLGRLMNHDSGVMPTPWGFPHPLFRRDEFGRISYPFECEGWYPTHSANALWKLSGDYCINEGWYFEPGNDIRPFANDRLNFGEMFNRRQGYRDIGREDLAYALKITLNSGYGKTAQRKGVELGDNLPAYHQIEWAASITDHCRIQIWEMALEAWFSGGLISIETDAIYTTTALPIESSGLGGIKAEKYDGICYLQSGVYFTKKGGEWSFHMRGLNKDALTIEQVREHLHDIEDWSEPWPPLFGATHTFNGIGYSRISDSGPDTFYSKWLYWQDAEREIKLGSPGLKRIHNAKLCEACKAGISPAKGLHDLSNPMGRAGISHPRRDAWIPEDEGVIWEAIKIEEEKGWN